MSVQLRSLAAITVGALVALSPSASAQLLGRIDFPNSGGAEAQKDFVEGVLYLHNFEYEDAADAFRRAREIDPDFALAYWGEAMTHNHSLWERQDVDAAQAVLDQLGATVEARQAKAPTPRERGYLRAVETLYGNTPEARGKSKEERDLLYRDAMRRLHQAFPEDHEATTFYALSILGTAHEGRDFAIYMRAAAVAQAVWAINTDHPGAAHYLIHSWDDPIHAPLGLPMAVRYAKIAPAAAHAQHMASHIFVATGAWDGVIEANAIARRVQNASRARRDQPPRECGHYPYWELYGHLQAGRHEDAAGVLDRCRLSFEDGLDGYTGWHFARMRARYVLDTGDWSAAERWTVDPQAGDGRGRREYLFTSAWAALERGEIEQARALRAEVAATPSTEPTPGDDEVGAILVQELDARLLEVAGETERAIATLVEAAEAEAAMPFSVGPPPVVKPSRELLAELLLEHGRVEEAAGAFRAQLERTPRRTTALLGLARASERTGDVASADDAYRELAEIWQAADATVAGLESARAAVAAATSP